MKSAFKKIHFIGIKGTAISGLAVIAKEQGYEVAGSDVPEEFVTDEILKRKNIKVFAGFSADNLSWNPDLVVAGASWTDENPEMAFVKKNNIPIMMHSEFMNELAKGKELIAISGAHGKTTTTSLLAFLLREAEEDPSFLIGAGASPELGTNAHAGASPYFVVEADEYKKSQTQEVSKFLDLDPTYIILTNIDLDHTDFFKSLDDMKESFRKFISKPSVKKIFIPSHDANIREIISSAKAEVIRIGHNIEDDYIISEVRELTTDTKFVISHKNQKIDAETLLPGEFSVMNSSLVLALLNEIGMPIAQMVKSLAVFRGALRRFQISQKGDLTVLDDYAHHPTAVKLTLDAARKRFPQKNIICVFQPHQVSRTKQFKNEFGKSFEACDEVIFADIFASAREKERGYTSADLAKQTLWYRKNVHYGGSLGSIAKNLSERHLGAHDLLITMGAGDVYKIVDSLNINS